MAPEFSTGAELELEVSQSSLSEARDTIESELGDLEVDVNAVVSGNSQQPRDPSSGRFMGIEGVEQRVVNTNDTLDSLIQIENERWELDKYRNDYLEQLADRGGVLQQGGQQSQDGGGGGILRMLGLGSLLGGGGGAAGAAAGGGVLAGAFGANQMFGQRSTGEVLGRSFMQSGGNPVSFATQTGAEIGRSIGLGEEAQSVIEGFGQGFEWPDLPALSEQDWPEIPDLTQNFDWPDPPEFDLNPFDSEQPDSTPRSTSGLQRRGPNDANQPVEPTINLGGITVDVTTTIDNAVDDAVDEVEDTVDREIGNLEDRIADAIGGFF